MEQVARRIRSCDGRYRWDAELVLVRLLASASASSADGSSPRWKAQRQGAYSRVADGDAAV
jgi:hypothetical protein